MSIDFSEWTAMDIRRIVYLRVPVRRHFGWVEWVEFSVGPIYKRVDDLGSFDANGSPVDG